MKPRKPVALKFDDGSEAGITDFKALRNYAESMRLKEDLRALAAEGRIAWPEVAEAAKQRQVVKLEKKKKKADASKLGGDATRERFARPGLDDLLRGYLARKEKPSVQTLAVEYGVTDQTIYNAIIRIKEEKTNRR